MNIITTQFTEKELTDLGRAMERAGANSLEDFIKGAVMQEINKDSDKEQSHEKAAV